jgi:serine/threonine-protein kinase
LEETDGIKALVLELVEGPTLADRIARGPVPLAETLPIARQIADALDAAHEQGIMHRDLKPANVKVRSDGMVKVLDFGLAKAFAPDAGATAADLANSPTLSMQATQAGMILGTAAYMSPEQASGKAVDKRSDLWSFSVVLMEMLTGRPVFAGETISHVLASVLTRDPDWTTLPAEAPTAVRRLLRRCLDKDRRRRLDSAAAARLEIEEALSSPGSDQTPAAPAPSGWHGVRWTFALVGAVILAVMVALARVALVHFREQPPLAHPVQFEIPLPDQFGLPISVSPDGRRIAFIAQRQIWVRALDSTQPRPLAKTEGAATFLVCHPTTGSCCFPSRNRSKRSTSSAALPKRSAVPVPMSGEARGTVRALFFL